MMLEIPAQWYINRHAIRNFSGQEKFLRIKHLDKHLIIKISITHERKAPQGKI